MNHVTVERKKVLEIIKKNREEHRDIFLKAQEGYKKKAIQLLEENLERAKRGRGEFVIQFGLFPPVDQTKEYDRAIAMLEMSVDDNIELTAQEFANYVQDEWNWTRQFGAANSAYVAAVGGAMPPKYMSD